MFNLFVFEHVSRLSIEIDNQQHRAIKMLAASEGMSIKELILQRTIGRAAQTESSAKVMEDETEFLFSSAVNFKRLRGAVTAPDEENIVFESLKDLEDALGI
ncbi:hypothetical protein ACFSSA_15225 [Luteolibacter algae]|uniref:Uncharacterized protein n=1 Tax=Luteolibacter algae TaxID=454151 RepID=A0ABW5DDD2_9BACT